MQVQQVPIRPTSASRLELQPCLTDSLLYLSKSRPRTTTMTMALVAALISMITTRTLMEQAGTTSGEQMLLGEAVHRVTTTKSNISRKPIIIKGSPSLSLPTMWHLLAGASQ
jgi:hypothetical protein